MLITSSLTHFKNDDLQMLCDSIADEQLNYVSIGIVDGKNLFSAFTNHKWQEMYVNNYLYLHDPCFQTAIQSPNTPIFWSSVPMRTKKSAAVVNSRLDMTQTKCGVTISVNFNDRLAVITLGTKEDEFYLLNNLQQMIENGLLGSQLCKIID
jgi:hypothetical protein